MDQGIPYQRFLKTFEPEDRAILAAVLLERSEQCSGCGLTTREFLDDPDAYQARQVVCPWCAARDRARLDGDTDATIPGASIKLVSKGVVERMLKSKVRRPKSRRERKRERDSA